MCRDVTAEVVIPSWVLVWSWSSPLMRLLWIWLKVVIPLCLLEAGRRWLHSHSVGQGILYNSNSSYFDLKKKSSYFQFHLGKKKWVKNTPLLRLGKQNRVGYWLWSNLGTHGTHTTVKSYCVAAFNVRVVILSTWWDQSVRFDDSRK